MCLRIVGRKILHLRIIENTDNGGLQARNCYTHLSTRTSMYLFAECQKERIKSLLKRTVYESL